MPLYLKKLETTNWPRIKNYFPNVSALDIIDLENDILPLTNLFKILGKNILNVNNNILMR